MKHILLAALLAPVVLAQPRQHVDSTISIHLNASPQVVLPLFGPVREAEWTPGWNPKMIHPAPPAQIQGAVFTVAREGGDSVWILTTYNEAQLRVGYVFFVPGLSVSHLEIELRPGDGGTTDATVTYHRTALSEAGDKDVANFAHHFPTQKQHWEQAINARLKEMAK